MTGIQTLAQLSGLVHTEQ